MAVRSGRVSGVLYVLWLLLAAKPAEAAVAARQTTATAKRRYRKETRTARHRTSDSVATRLSFPKLYDLAGMSRYGLRLGKLDDDGSPL